MKLILQKVGGFLINLIQTNRRETVAGSTINEVEITSGIFGLNLNDLFKGLVMSVLGAVVGDLYAMLQAGTFVIDWQAIKHGAIVAAVAYIMKQIGTPSQRILKLLLIGLLFSLPSFGQNNATVKALQSWNADSTTVRALANLDSIMGRNTGWLFYNNQSRKWRVGIATPDSVTWYDLLGGSGGAGLTTADNGLTVNPAGNVQLGGTLLDNTEVDGITNSKTLSLNGSSVTVNSTGVTTVSATGTLDMYGNNAANLTTTTGDMTLFSGAGVSITANTLNQLNLQGGGVYISQDGGSGIILDASSGSPGNVLINGGTATQITSGADVFIAATTTATLSGSGGVIIDDSGTNTQVTQLAGTGTRMVTADASGNLSSQAIPSGGNASGSLGNIQFNGTGNSFDADTRLNWNQSGAVGWLSVKEGASDSVRIDGNQIQFSTGVEHTSGGLQSSSNTTITIQPGSNGNLDINTTGTGTWSAEAGGSINLQNASTLLGVEFVSGAAGDFFIRGLSSGAGRYLIISGLPTSSAGLPSGAIWSNAGVLTVVP